MRKIRVFVDTSVFGGVFDAKFAEGSQFFFEHARRGDFVIVISEIIYRELMKAPGYVREILDKLPDGVVEMVEVSDDARMLAKAYIEAEIVGVRSADDALHVAVATDVHANAIVSWNFKHIVNFNKMHQYNAINALKGFSHIEILDPPQLTGEI